MGIITGLAPGTAHHVLSIIRDWDVPEQTDTINQVKAWFHDLNKNKNKNVL